MIYRFVIISDEVDDFRRDIKINADVTFWDFHQAIIDSVGYEASQITSFTICDESWNKTKEVSMIDESRSMEEDVYLMKDTTLDEFLTEERQKLMYHFDMLGDRAFFIELREIVYGETIDKPEVVRSKGNPPRQESDIEELLAAPVVAPPVAKSSSGSYGSNDDFNDDDFYNEDFELDSLDTLDEHGIGIEDDIF